MTSDTSRTIPFKAETSQLLNILIHSLYTEREVFLRELISNASDALTRMNYEQLTHREVVDPERELAIWIESNPDERILTITDSGVGMTSEEMVENLGTIAHSGARAFLEAASDHPTSLSEIIGQFGVGFYAAFMVAEWISVTSRSYRPEAVAATWYSTGTDTYTLLPAEQSARGTVVRIKLKEDAAEFAQENRLGEIIKKHSDYVPYPIYLGKDGKQANRQTALWRQQPRQMEETEYHEFYKQLTLDPQPPLSYAHLNVDAPVQMYAVLFVPSSSERPMFSLRVREGIKLYARKVLIQEYSTDLLPEYLGFVDGVVDTEDLPLNVSRETVQSTRVMAQLRKLVTAKVLDTLKQLGKEKPDKYELFWKTYSRAIKHGVATDPDNTSALIHLLRFHTLQEPDRLSTLEDYVEKMKPGQEKIYYLVGDDQRSLARSPHLDQFRRSGYDVLLLADPIDSFMLLRLTEFQEHPLANASSEMVEKPIGESEDIASEHASATQRELNSLLDSIQQQLGDRVSQVRESVVLDESPARLVDPEGAMTQEFQRVYKLLNKEFEIPKKVLEINPRHPLVLRLAAMQPGSQVAAMVIEQLFEDALLIEGLHPDPASMIDRIQRIMEEALRSQETIRDKSETPDH